MSAGRPREFNFDAALDRALHVFWSKGYEGTSLPDLTEAMGINRPSLYATFGNKEELFRKALERYAAESKKRLDETLDQPTAYAAIEKLLYGMADGSACPKSPKGCLLVQGALACGEEAQPIKEELVRRRQAAETAMRRRFERGIAEGDIPPTTSASDLARFYATVMHGMSIQSTGGASPDDLRGVAQCALMAFPREISFYPGWMMKNWLSINVDALIKTAELGDVTQQFNLGMMYMDGRNVARDPAEGMKWLRKAAQQGNASAQNNIGNFLMRNWHKEIPQDYAEAYFWHSLAAKADYYNNADEAAKHLTEEQIRQIDQRVSEWKPIPTNPSPELHFIQKEISDAEVSRAPTLDDFDPISEVIDMPISITIKTIPQLSEFKHGEKFTDLPGKNNLEEKKRLKGYLDKLTDKVISEISVNPSKLWLLKQFQIALIATQEEDTEAQEHFSAELIKLMNILGIQNSDGLIEYYRYGDLAYMLHEFKADKK